MHVYALDIETDSLDPTRIWCVCAVNVDTKEERQWTYPDKIEEEKQSFLSFLSEVDYLVMHNGLSFDLPVINNLLGLNVPYTKVIDTLVWSRLDDFSREGGHSLKAWGLRNGGKGKGDHTDFSILSQDMLDYCMNDCHETIKVYKKLKPRWFDTEASRIEHHNAHLCWQMNQDGFLFDHQKAKDYLSEIEARIKELNKEFRRVFEPRLVVVNTLKWREKKDGTLFSSVEKAKKKHYKCVRVGDNLECYDWHYFDPASPKDRIDSLWSAGWKPTDMTEGHKKYVLSGEHDPVKKARFDRYGWKVNETNLATLPSDKPGTEGAQKLSEWLVLEGRRSTLVEWLGQVHQDSRIHATFQHIGAWTGRMSHRNPNMANIPATYHGEAKSAVDRVKKDYDGLFRGLWVVPEGSFLVGTDAEGIQLRILAHLMKSQPYVDAIITGNKDDETDIHNLNKKALGLSHVSRDMAKTFIYAFLLGAGVTKVAEILNTNTQVASQTVQNFLDNISGLRHLKDEVIPKAANKGYFTGLDGRRVLTPSLHHTLAGMLQNGEAVIMKKAAMLWTEELSRLGVEYKVVTWAHDEWQTEVKGSMDKANLVGKLQREAIEKAGEQLNLFCPLAGSTMIGSSWADTH